MKPETIVSTTTPLEIRILKWRNVIVPEFYIRNDGVLFHNDRQCSSWQIKGRNYSKVCIDGRWWTYRIDYMVAYTFKGFPNDAIRLVHINDNIADDRVDNLMWVCKTDIIESYRDLVVVESDGTIMEEWKPCNTEFNPGLGYEVSNMGLIRDKDHNLVPLTTSHGYTVFYYIDSKYAKQTRVKPVHRAVAEAFIPNPNKYDIVNHLDGNTHNNMIMNLEWANSSMNSEHAYLTGLNQNRAYNRTQLINVCKLLEQNCSHVQISFITGVDRKTISDIYRGRRHTDISSHFKMPEKRWTPETKQLISDYIIQGKKGKEIASIIGRDYDQPFISLYERTRRELKTSGKI